MEPVSDLGIESLARSVLDRCLRAVLHRLRGIRTVLNGWLVMGLPDEERATVERLMKEEQTLLERIDRIRSLLHEGPTVETMAQGELPLLALAAAFGLGTPEQVRERVPKLGSLEAAIGLALWLEAQGGGQSIPLAPPPQWRFVGDKLRIELPSGDAPCPASWRARFGEFLAEDPRPGALLFLAGCFLPGTASGAASGPAGEETP